MIDGTAYVSTKLVSCARRCSLRAHMLNPVVTAAITTSVKSMSAPHTQMATAPPWLVTPASKDRTGQAEELLKEIAPHRHIKILFGVRYHCELNEIEMFWSRLKGKVAK